jgi:crotonobetainyl-CoA:carnitine CoA-transferase CaiB-like acyl-CoA transferase
LVNVTVKPGVTANLPALPLRMNGRRGGVTHDVPEPGEHSEEILSGALGLGPDEIAALRRAGAFA